MFGMLQQPERQLLTLIGVTGKTLYLLVPQPAGGTWNLRVALHYSSLFLYFSSWFMTYELSLFVAVQDFRYNQTPRLSIFYIWASSLENNRNVEKSKKANTKPAIRFKSGSLSLNYLHISHITPYHTDKNRQTGRKTTHAQSARARLEF